jgi:hypothetical protein
MIYKLLIFIGAILPVFAEEKPPQTVTLDKKSPSALLDLNYTWFNPVAGCDLLNYHLFDYTDRHPDRVKFSDDSEVASIEGFVDYLATKSPIFVRGMDGAKYSLIFFREGILTPWGDEIIFLIDRNSDGYLKAFGEQRSVNHFADPWKMEGFKYTKAVGITMKKRPSFMGEGASVIVPLNDNDYTRLKESVLPQNQEAEQGGTGQPATRPESKSEGGEKPQPGAEGRSR